MWILVNDQWYRRLPTGLENWGLKQKLKQLLQGDVINDVIIINNDNNKFNNDVGDYDHNDHNNNVLEKYVDDDDNNRDGDDDNSNINDKASICIDITDWLHQSNLTANGRGTQYERSVLIF